MKRHKTKFFQCIIITMLCIGCNGEAQQDQVSTKKTDSKLTTHLKVNPTKETVSNSKSVMNKTLAAGHLEVRKLLGNDIGQMQFDTQAANTFRSYMTNTLLTTTSYNNDSGYGNSHSASGSGRIQFCANGTYVEATSSQVIINTEGAGATSSGITYVPGYWEVAALPKGLFVILLYSTHPRMLEDSPNGLLPWIVPKYGDDFVALPNGELYKRTANQSCN